MIRSIRHRGLKRLFERDDRSGIRPDLADTVQEILTVLEDAATPQELNLPGYRLHPLKGDLKGFWSVTVRANWRIIFRFEGTDACDVELIDYHWEREKRHAHEKPRPSRTHRKKRLP
jgi:proteic killer suppression protein